MVPHLYIAYSPTDDDPASARLRPALSENVGDVNVDIPTKYLHGQLNLC